MSNTSGGSEDGGSGQGIAHGMIGKRVQWARTRLWTHVFKTRTDKGGGVGGVDTSDGGGGCDTTINTGYTISILIILKRSDTY